MNPDPKSRKNAEKKNEKTPDAKVAIAKGHNSGTWSQDRQSKNWICNFTLLRHVSSTKANETWKSIPEN